MRAKMVTRQMTTTTATVMTVSKSTGATNHVTDILSGKFENNDAILKALVKRYKGSDVQPVFIKEVTVENTLYGMKEEDFIKSAIRLDANRNPIHDEEGQPTESIED